MKEDTAIPQNVITLIMIIEKALFDVYLAYYSFEKSISMSYDEGLSKSIAASFTLLGDFEICPLIISKPEAFYIIQSIINKEKSQLASYIKPQHVSGRIFTFDKFVEFFIKIAIFNCQDSSNVIGIWIMRPFENIPGENRVK